MILTDKIKHFFYYSFDINIIEDEKYIYIDKLKIVKHEEGELLIQIIKFVNLNYEWGDNISEKFSSALRSIYKSIFNVLFNYGNTIIDKSLITSFFVKLNEGDYNSVFETTSMIINAIVTTPQTCGIKVIYEADKIFVQYWKNLTIKTQYPKFETYGIKLLSMPINILEINKNYKPIIMNFNDVPFIESLFAKKPSYEAFKTLVINNDFFEFGDKNIQKLFDVIINLEKNI